MSREADKVSNVLSGVDAIEKRAEEVGGKLAGAFAELHDALNMAEQYGDGVLRAAGKIKGFLRLQTNSGPIEDAQVIEDQRPKPALPSP